MAQVGIPAGYASSSFEWATTLGVISRRVVRHEADGPTVILIHEAPGLSPSTFAIAQVLIDHGYRVVMPALLDAPWTGGTLRHQTANIIKICVAREMAALSAGRTGAIVEWLRALADAEYEATGHRPVGVIGMCFSGGFALGTITNPKVRVAVMSQPALPFVFRWHRSDLGVSRTDLALIHDRPDGNGGCIRAMRFSRDWKSPRTRLKLIKKEFPDATCKEIETDKRSNHSVLAMALDAPEGSELHNALLDTIAFLNSHLMD
jgi:dienelactone hydrolase